MAGFDRLEQILSGVVDARNNLGVALSVGGPEHNDLVEVVVRLEVSIDYVSWSPIRSDLGQFT